MRRSACFLKSGDRPILIGGELGKGRVACLLVDYRGKSEPGVTAFFDWQAWPQLVEGVMRWLVPDTGRTAPATVAKPDTEAKAILSQFQGTGMDDAIDTLDKPRSGGLGLPGDDAPTASRELKGGDLQKRLALIDRALACGGLDIAAALAGQLATVNNLSLEVRLRIVSLLQRERPPAALALGRDALHGNESVLHGSGYLLLAVAGDPGFARQLASPQAIAGETEAAKQERLRDLALAVALYPKPDMVEEGRRRVESWNRQEAAARTEFGKLCGPDAAMLETSPCLDADAIVARLAWLAYLSRYEPKTYAEPFLRQWLMIGQYQDYCERTLEYDISQHKLAGAVANASAQGWHNLSARLGALRGLTQADVEALLANAPVECAAGLAGARFAPEVRAAIDLLGTRDANTLVGVLTPLTKAANPDLAAFAAARLGGNKK